MYSDAEYTPGRQPRLGWVAFKGEAADDQELAAPPILAHTLLLDKGITDQWQERKTQIFAAEAIAPSIALVEDSDHFMNKDIVWFVDNEGACSTLIRGACSPEDVSGIAELTQLLAMRLGARIWFEWIDSKANPSDGLSRDGLGCPLFGAVATDARRPEWQVAPDHATRLRRAATAPLASLV